VPGQRGAPGALPAILGFAACVFAASSLPFLRTVAYGFVNLDDYEYVAAHAQVSGGLSLPGMRWAFAATGDGIWMPLTWMSYMLDCSLWGAAPGAMRAVNIAVHALNAVLLFLLLLRLSRPGGPGAGAPDARLLSACAAAALLWSVHPLRAEPVVWVASRKDVLSFFWEALALTAWIKRLERAGSPAHAVRWGVAAAACFVLSAMSKPSAMTFPVLAGLLEYLKAGRVRWRDYCCPAVLACATGYVASYAQADGGATLALAHVPFSGRLANAAAAFGVYCWKTFCPAGLAVQCGHRWPGMPRFWLQGAAICGAYGGALLFLSCRLFKDVPGALLARLRAGAPPPRPRRRPGPGARRPAGAGSALPLAFASLSFSLAAVAPTLGFSAFGAHSYADRFTYLPAVGPSMLLAGLLARRASTGAFRPALLLCLLALPALSALTFLQAGRWRDDLTLFSRTIEVDGDRNVLANIHLGMYHYEYTHDIEKAIPFFGRALECDEKKSGQIYPLYVICLCEAGRVREACAAAGRLSEWAAERVDEARRREGRPPGGAPRRAVASYVAYAAISIADGDYGLAREHLGAVLSVQPESVFAHYLLGRLALAEGDREGAVRHWRMALDFDSEPYLRHRFLAREIGPR
jgi:tetratricopeptide (TPR) repeat protein